MLLIENGTLHTGNELIRNGMIMIDGGRIEVLGAVGSFPVPAEVQHIDAAGGHIAAGFIDMHTHGALGCDLHNATLEDIQRIAQFEAATGVTAYVPTTITASFDDVLHAVTLARQAMDMDECRGAKILGVHIEGPYLNREMRGAHPAHLIRDPRPEEYNRLLEHADIICTMTLAPELPGALELIKALAAKGVLASAGHTQAIEPELNRAIEAGLRHVTHIFGNMSTLRRENLTRVAGTVEMTLCDDRLSTEVIGDGHHISAGLMQLVYQTKGPTQLALITDASPLTGLASGSYNVWGGEVVVDGEICFLPDRSAFAGSLATMDRCLRNLVRMANVPLDEALRTASATPAAILGISNRKGTLAKGMDADVVILDEALQVTHTVAAGALVFERHS